MYPYISQVLAEQHTRELQNEATWAHRARQARRARRAKSAPVKVRVPESYEDFLCLTAESVMREPTASGRAGGQTVR
jgi:hypothetical protein